MSSAKKITAQNGESMLSAKTASKRLKCAADYVGKLCREGKLEGQQIDGAWFVSEVSIALFEKARKEAKALRSAELVEERKAESAQYRKLYGEESNTPVEVSTSTPTFTMRPFAATSFGRSAMLAVGAAFLFAAVVFAGGTGGATFFAKGQQVAAVLAEVQSPFFGGFNINTQSASSLQNDKTPTDANFFSDVFAFLFGNNSSTAKIADATPAPVQTAVATVSPVQSGPVAAQATTTKPASTAGTTIVQNTYPVIERTVVQTQSGITQADLDTQLSALSNNLKQLIYSNINSAPGPVYASGGVTNNTALSQIINQLNNVTITGGTLKNINGVDLASGCFSINGVCITGGGNAAGSTGAIQFNNGGAFDASTTQFFWDAANDRLGIGTSTPNTALSLGAGGVISITSNDGSSNGCFAEVGGQLQYSNDCNTYQSFTAAAAGGWTDTGTTVHLTTGSENVGVGTSTPFAKLTVWGADNSAATNAFAVVNAASTTLLSVNDAGQTTLVSLLATGSTTLQNVTALNATTSSLYTTTLGLGAGDYFTSLLGGGLVNNNGTLSVATSTFGFFSTSSVLAIQSGGTGTSTAPAYGQVLLGNGIGGYSLVATSSLGIVSGSGNSFGKTFEINGSGYLAPTTTIALLANGGFVSQASSSVVGNFNVSGNLAFSNYGNCTLKTDASGNVTCGTDLTGGGGGGTDVNWNYFNGSGLRPATTTNQVLIGASATSTLAKLQVVGGAFFDNATSTALYASSFGLGGSYFTSLLGTGLVNNNGTLGIATSSLGLLATSSLSATAPLLFNVNTGAFSISQSGTTTNGYLSSTDFNTFNNKISSSSLSAQYPLAYNASTGVFSSNFGTTTANTFSQLNTFNGGLFATNASTTNATTTSFAITNISGALLKTLSNGAVVAAVAGVDYATPGSSSGFDFTPTVAFGTAANATSTLIGFTGGLYATASSTISTLTTNNLTVSNFFADASGTSTFTGNLIPSANNTYALGSPTNAWKEVYIGPGSLFVNGQEVLHTDGSNNVVVSSSINQNLVLETTGTANIELNPSGTGALLVKSGITLTGGKSFTTSDSSSVLFPSGIAAGNITVSGSAITANLLNGGIALTPNGSGNTYVTAGNFGIGTTSPTNKLEVNGASYLGGNVTITGNTLAQQATTTNLAVTSVTSSLLKTLSNGAVVAAQAGVDYAPAGADTFAYPFPNNATSTTLTLASGFVAPASSTIGNGTAQGGLTVAGNATTTGSVQVNGGITVNGSVKLASVTGSVQCLHVGANGIISGTGSDCGTGGGGSGTFLGLTDVPASYVANQVYYTNATADAVTASNNFTFDGTTLTAPTISASTLTVGGSSSFGTVIAGVWHGSPIADAYINDNLTINGGTVNNSPIGAVTPSTGVFTNATTSNFTAYKSASFGGTATSSFAGNGALTLAQALAISSGGTGTSTAPAYGQLLLGNVAGGYDLVSTSSLGIISGVTSVTNSDGTLTISPTLGAVVASLNVSHANSWIGPQAFVNLFAVNASSTNATSGVAFITSLSATNATTTNLAVTGAANLASLTLGSALSVNSGGTGSTTLGGILTGNGTGGVTSAAIAAPLSFSGNTLSISQSGLATNGYLSSTDFNTFNNKISSSSLSAQYPLAYNASTGVFSSNFGTTTANTFSQLNIFNGGLNATNATVGSLYASTLSGTALAIGGTATTTIDSAGNLLVQGGTGAGTSLDVNGSANALYYNVQGSQFIDNAKNANVNSVSINYGNAVIDSSGKAVFAQATTSNLAIANISSALLKTLSNGAVVAAVAGTDYVTPSGLGIVFPFTASSNYGVNDNSTSTPIAFLSGIFASSTSHFANADFLNATFGAATSSSFAVNGSTTVSGQFNALGGATFGNATINTLSLSNALSVANGGTGSTTLGGILAGNGAGAVKSLVVGSGLTFDGTTLATNGAGVTAIGPLGQTQTGGTQLLATSTNGTDFTITAAGNTQTFNLPFASVSATGKLAAADFANFQNKISSSSLSGQSVISYNSGNGVITTTGGTFGLGDYTFPSNVLTTGTATAFAGAQFGSTATSSFSSAGVLTLASALSIANGGTNNTGFSPNSLLYFDGTKIAATSSNSLYVGSLIATTTTATSTLNGGLAVANSLFVLQNGNIGIGNSTPTKTLDVTGTGRFSGVLTLSTALSCTGNEALQTDVQGNVVCGSLGIANASTGGGWTTNNIGLVTIATSSDLVAIGATSTPYAKLSILSGGAATTTLALVPANGQTANIIDIYNNAGALASVLTAGGNLGLGTTSPFATLSVAGDIVATGNLSGANIVATGTLSAGGTTLVTTAGGNVGIGTSSPSSHLSIAGGNLTQIALGNPTLATTVPAIAGAHSYKTFISGNYAYEAEYEGGLRILDVSNPKNPVQVGTYSGLSSVDDVIVSGKYAYVADASAGVAILDVSNPASPSLVGSYAISALPYVTGIALSGKYLVATDITNHAVRVLDISNPTSPALAGTYSGGGSSFPYALAVSGKYAYVADYGGSVYVLDISNPTLPIKVSASYTTGVNSPDSVYVSGKYVYVSDDGGKGMYILNASNPAALSLAGTYNPGGSQSYEDVKVAGNYAYLADDAGNLVQVDVSNKTAPALVGSYALGGVGRGVALAGKYAYVSSNNQGLEVVDINGIESPAANIGSLAANIANISDTLNVGGDIFAGGGINAGYSGIFSRGGLSVSGSTTLQSTLNVSGLSTLANLFVTGSSTLGNFTAGNAVLANATTTTFFASVASTTNLTISSVLSSLLKTTASGQVVAAVAGTDYVTPAALTAATAFPFTPTTNYGVNTSATTTPIYAINGLFASSTSHFANADFTGATSTGTFAVTGSTTIGSVLNVSGNGFFGSSVGIGTTSPWAQFSINPNGITGPAFAIGSSTGTSFVVTNGGQVGIGTTSPFAALSIQGANSVSGSNAAAPNALYVQGGLGDVTGAGGAITFVTGGSFGSSGSGGAFNVTTGSDTYVHGSGGNINFVAGNGGTGAASQGGSFSVTTGSTGGSGAGGGNINLTTGSATSSGNGGNFTFTGGNATSSGIGGGFSFTGGNGGPSLNSTGNGGNVTFNGGAAGLGGGIVGNIILANLQGNVGVGTTSPFSKFSVQGNGYLSGNLTAANITATGTLQALNVLATGSTTITGAFNSVSSNLLGSTTLLGNSLFSFATTTNFAITGTANTLLKTLSNGAVVAAIAGTDYVTPAALTAATVFPFTPGTNFGVAENATSTPIFFTQGIQASSTSQFVNANFFGNVGIGTTSPYNALSVNGTTTSTGIFNIDNGAGNLLSYLGSTTISVAGTNNFFAGLGANGSTTKTNGTDNVLIGNQAGYAVTSFDNVYIGSQSGIGSTTGAPNSGAYNTAVGYQTLKVNSTGTFDNAFGYGALSTNTTGIANSAFGLNALGFNTTGSDNDAFGVSALGFNTTGSNNTAIGYGASFKVTSGTNNTALGSFAGYSVSTGYSNTLLGDNSTTNNTITTGFGNLGLGSNVFFQDPSANGQLNIGNLIYGSLPATTTGFALPTSGKLGVGTSSPFAKFAIQTNNGDTATTLFAIGSSTQSATSTLFSVNNIGSTTLFQLNSSLLKTNANGTIVAAIPGVDFASAASVFGYLFPGNATTTQIAFNGGLTAVGATTTALAVTGSTTISGQFNAVGGATFGNTTVGALTIGSLNGLVGANNGVTYAFASSSLFGYTPLNPTRNINTTYPLQGGGNLTGDLTLSSAFGTTTQNFFNAYNNFSSLFATNASSTNATTTGSLYLTALSAGGLAVDNTGRVYSAATSTLATISGTLALTQLANQAAGTFLANGTANSAAPTAIATSSIFGTGTGGQVLSWNNGVPQWIASTTYANGAGISTSFANGQLTITNTGALFAYPFPAGATSSLVAFNGGATFVGATTTALAVTGSSTISGVFNSTFANLLGSTTLLGNSLFSFATTTNFAITGTANTLLKTLSNGAVVAAIAGTDYVTPSALTAATVFPFTPGTNFGVAENATSTPIFFTQGIQASSTSQFASANFYNTLSVATSTSSASLTSAASTTVIGSELMTDGNFATNPASSGWTLGYNVTYNSGAQNVSVLCSSTGCIDATVTSNSFSTTAGHNYLVQFDYTGAASSSARINLNNTSFISGPLALGHNAVVVTATFTGADNLVIDSLTYGANASYTIDNVSMKEVTYTPAFRLFAQDGTSLLNLGDAGSSNFSIGYHTLLSNTGFNNTANGDSALTSNTTGSNNTAYGLGSLFSNTAGFSNTANGVKALFANTTGYNNTANGNSALTSNTTGFDNTANGVSALSANITGNYNTANGVSALASNTTGFDNTANGVSALSANTTGTNNTVVGFQAGFSVSTGYSNTLIGDNSTANNTITTGGGNIGLGSNVFFPSAGGNSQLNIGNLIYGSLPATTTGFALPTSGSIGIGTSSPFAKFAIQTNRGDTATTLFAVGSSTQSATSTLFSISNTGSTTLYQLNSSLLKTNANGTIVAAIPGVDFASAASVFGYLFPGNATTTQIAFNGGLTAVGATTTALAVTGSTTITGAFNSVSSNLLGSTTLLGNSLFSFATTTNFAITGTANTLLKTLSNGAVVAAVAGTDYVTPAALTAATVFPFTPDSTFAANANSTSTLIGFTQGLYALASSTIGGGAQASGLTISGGATTTGNAYFAGNVGIGTITPTATFAVVGVNSTAPLGSPAPATFSVLGGTSKGGLGGSITLTGGLSPSTGLGSGLGGPITLTGGISSSTLTTARGGAVTITGGSGSSDLNTVAGGGSVIINGGAPGPAGTVNGNVLLATLLGSVGVGSTSPFAQLSINANNGFTNTTLFAIGSSTQSATSTLFSISNTGAVTLANLSNTLLYANSAGVVTGSSTLAVNNGGTGSSTLTGILVGNGTGAVQTLTVGSGLTLSGTTLSTSGAGITALGPLGQTQSGGTQTLATSSATTISGLSVGLTITASGNTQTFTPTFTGTISGLTTANLASANVSQFTNDAGYVNAAALAAAFPFTPTSAFGTAANATGTLIGFTQGLYALASSTIGNGTQAGGLTISGGATTTGSLVVGQPLTLQHTQLQVSAPGQASSNIPVDVLNVDIGAPTSGTRTGYGPGILFTDPAGLSVSQMARIAAVYEPSGTNFYSGLAFYTDPGAGGLAERLRITNTGNLGIGTTSPFAKLAISANLGDTNTQLFNISSTTGGTATSTLFSISNTGSVHVGNPAFADSATPLDVVTDTSGHGIHLMSSDFNNTTAGSLLDVELSNGSGNSLSSSLQVWNSGRGFTGNLLLNPSGGAVGIGTTTPWAQLSVNSVSGQPSPLFAVGSSTRTAFVVTNSGNVGVGIANPLYPLHVFATSTTMTGPQDILAVEVSSPGGGGANAVTAGYGPALVFKDGTAQNSAYMARIASPYEQTGDGSGNHFSGALSFYTQSLSVDSTGAGLVERARITKAGNFGIGTTSPFAKLAISANLGDTNTQLFNISSTTGGTATSTLFSISNTGNSFLSGTASSTNLVVSSAGGTPGCATFSANGTLSNTGVACGTGGGGSAFPFTPTINFGVNTSATSTPIYAVNGLFASSTSNIWALNLGSSTPQAFTNAPLVISGNTNNYVQAVLQNNNSGNTASADFIVGGDLMTNTTYYGDLGYNSSGNADPSYTGFGPNDLYLYNSDGSLDLASASTTNTNAAIKFFTGGSLAANEAARITSAGNFGLGTTSPWGLFAINAKNGETNINLLTIASSTSATTTTFATLSNTGFFSIGASTVGTPSGVFSVDAQSGTTTISNLSLGNLAFDTDAGVVNFSDIPVDSSAAAGVQQAQILNIGSTPVLTISGIANGSGGVTNLDALIGATSTQPVSTLEVWGPDAAASTNIFSLVNSASTTLFTVQDGGNVGIGSTSPFALLSVQGNGYFAGNVTATNVIATGTLQALNILATGSTTLQNFTAVNATTSQATTTNFAITGTANTLLKTLSNGAVVAAVAGTDYLTSATTFAYPFPSNATTTQIAFNGGATFVGATTTALAVTGSTTISGQFNAVGGATFGSLSAGATTISSLTLGSLNGVLGANNGVTYAFASSSLFGYTPLNPTRNINTTYPLQGGGNLIGDLTLTSAFGTTTTWGMGNNGLVMTGATGIPFAVATSSPIALNISGNAATVTTNANLSGVITSSGNATSFGSQTAGVLGSAVTGNTSVLATSTLFGTGTGGQVLSWNNGVPQWIASTTYANGAGISTSFANGQLTITNTGALFAYPFPAGATSSLVAFNGGATFVGATTTALAVTGSTTITGAFNSVASNLLGSTTLIGNSLFSFATTTNFAITGISSSLLKTLSNGAVVAAIAGTDYVTPAALTAATVFPFTPGTNFGAAENATSTPIFFTQGIQASSTSQFASANFYNTLSVATSTSSASLTAAASTTIIGSELITDGNFATDPSSSGWTLGSHATYNSGPQNVSVLCGSSGCNNLAIDTNSFSTTAGHNYLVQFDYTGAASSSPSISFNNNTFTSGQLSLGHNTVLVTASFTGSDYLIIDSWTHGANSSYTIDNVSMKEVTYTPAFRLFAQDGTSLLNLGDAGNTNFSIGLHALASNTTGTNNTANGNNALYFNTSGTNNTANGNNALFYNTSGANNTANGNNALYFNNTGNYNTANGNNTLRSNTTGSDNTANGESALRSNTTGIENTANGESALYSNTTGSDNTVSGINALYFNTTGSNNTVSGNNALFYNTTGSNNTANGDYALFNTTGSSNTVYGYQAGYSVSYGYSNTLIGDNSTTNTTITSGFGNVGLGSNVFFPSAGGNSQLNIGNLIYGSLPATTTGFALPTSGSIGIGTSSPFAKFAIQSNNGDTAQTLFAIGSSTQSATSTLFSISNTGSTTLFQIPSSILKTNSNGTIVAAVAGTDYVTPAALTAATAFPFTPGTNFGAAENATSTPIFFTAGLQASSTVQFGNAGASNFTYDSANGALDLGAFASLPATPLLISTTTNNFIQSVIQNLSNGNNASADLIVSNDKDASAVTYYTDLGQNSSGYAQASQNAENAGDSFLTASDGAMVIGTASSTNTLAGIRFVTGGLASSSIRAVITPTGSFGLGTTTPTATFAVQGGAGQIVDFATSAGASAFHIMSGGNVGIGSTTPGSIFAINNIVNFTAATTTFESTGGVNISSGCFAIGGVCLSATGGGSSFGKTFEVNGLGAAAYLAPTTTLGIIVNASSTIGNGAQAGGLTIAGGATTTGTLAVQGTGTSTFSGPISVTSGCFALNGTCLSTGGGSVTGTTGQVAYLSGTNAAAGTSSLFIAPTGNVGVGTTSPYSKLTVWGTDTVAGNYSFLVSNSASTTEFAVDDAGTGYLANALGIGTSTPTGLLSITTSGGTTPSIYVGSQSAGTQFVVTSGGNVGIGTSSPSSILAVSNPSSNAQFTLSYDQTRYTTMLVDASGNLNVHASNGGVSGGGVKFSNDNLWVCQAGACPNVATSTAGNLFVENAVVIGDGFSVREINTTDLGLYGTDGELMVTFDHGN